MERSWLKYVGVILGVISGILIGFGLGMYTMFSIIVRQIADISGELVKLVPLIGWAIAKQVEEGLYSYLMATFSPDVALYYLIGFILMIVSVASAYLSKPTKTEAKPVTVPQAPQIMFCKYCGSQLTPDAKFCPNCGKPQT